MRKEEDKVVLWRKLTRALRKLYTGKDVNKEFSKNNEPDSIAKESENMLSPDRVSNVLPVPSEESRPGGREGNTTHTVEASSARDMNS